MNTLTTNLTLAWYARRQRTLVELTHAHQAPALFKPERVRQLEADFAHAGREAARWSQQ